jgi:8-oxo-dGTP diphosphatase
VLLVRRGDPPYEDAWALPGGFVEYGEHVEEACLRELQEETGLEGEIHRLVNVYSDPDRDPRGHVVSAVYKVLPRGGEPEAADDAAEARYLPLADLPEMAFDHGIILMDFMDEYGVDASTFAKD